MGDIRVSRYLKEELAWATDKFNGFGLWHAYIAMRSLVIYSNYFEMYYRASIKVCLCLVLFNIVRIITLQIIHCG